MSCGEDEHNGGRIGRPEFGNINAQCLTLGPNQRMLEGVDNGTSSRCRSQKCRPCQRVRRTQRRARSHRDSFTLRRTVGISWGVDWLDGFVIDDVQTSLEPVVYWRPGCPFCSMLRAALQRAGIAYREVNIWEDPQAAAFVRSVARGNETVPTVTVGSVSLVNPSAGEVAALLATTADAD